MEEEERRMKEPEDWEKGCEMPPGQVPPIIVWTLNSTDYLHWACTQRCSSIIRHGWLLRSESYPSLCTYLLLTCVPTAEQCAVDSSSMLSNIWLWLKQIHQKTKLSHESRKKTGREEWIDRSEMEMRWGWRMEIQQNA